MVNRTKKGRFLKPTQVARYNQQLKNLHKSSEECDQLVNLDTFVPLFDTQSTPAAGSTLDDHSYIQSTGSFDEINEAFFSGKLRALDFTRHVVDLQALFNNMKCVDCANVSLKFKDAVGVLPAGICGHLVIRCYNCLRFVQVAMGKTHSSPHGQQIFDVNTKLATGMYNIHVFILFLKYHIKFPQNKK